MSNWRTLAVESLEAAEHCLRKGLFRSSVSRAYYAVYSIVCHHILKDAGVSPPKGREAWSHERTPALLMERLLGTWPPQLLKDTSRRLRACYRDRISADYYPGDDVSFKSAARCVADANAVVSQFVTGKVVHDVE